MSLIPDHDYWVRSGIFDTFINTHGKKWFKDIKELDTKFYLYRYIPNGNEYGFIRNSVWSI
ncbi:MAG: hypothetical protein MjAS7_2355 [Metallosphaera javensis (ex Sakai et al. 2022)]|nr:MAG: hypothetical protein MjAS7_2355 [Metallosphaera javensis (ex Sakai et al. 2022)]